MQTQLQRISGNREGRMPMAGETEHPLYHAFVLPAGQSQPLTKREALVYTEIVAALAGASPPATVANGDGTFTHTVQFAAEA